ncbi:MAG: hypothetical protein R3305_09030 [Gammaproteobacteria bacterium]|nr:hypothetical protein [Gammaproteobacteria bacterium]
MPLSTDEQSLLIVAVVYVIAVAIWLLSLQVRGRLMLRTVRKRVDPELWQALGEPDTLQAALKDPERRWHRFVKSGEYRNKLSGELVELIDDYRRRTKAMLVIVAGGGLLILIRYWPLLKPDFL